MIGNLNRAALMLLVAPFVLGPAVPVQAHRDPPTRSLDLAATALPSAGRLAVEDDAFVSSTARHRQVDAEASATSSADCNRCVGDAGVLQVLYLPRARKVDLDNVAAAWSSQCSGCEVSALSVQVTVMRPGGQLTANNRALALNAACEACRSSAAAIQLVVVDRWAQKLSGAALRELRGWVAAQSLALRGQVDPRARTQGAEPAEEKPLTAEALRSLESLVNDDLDSTTRARDLDVQTP